MNELVDGPVTVHVGDALSVLRQLASASVDVCITDPPYNVGKDYGPGVGDRRPDDEYRAWLGEVFAEVARVATNGLVYFPGTSNLFAVPEVLDRAGLPLRRVLGWHKREYAGDKFAAGPAMCWEPIIWAAREAGWNRQYGMNGRDFLVVNATHGDPYSRLHPCPKSPKVMRWLITMFSRAGETILDPFAGSGTTLAEARWQDRRAVGIELQGDYLPLIKRRIADLPLLELLQREEVIG